ncbi:type III effector HopAZ1 [Pseudomonas syringae]
MINSIRGGAGTSSYHTQPQPFDELKLKPEVIEKKTERLKDKGYFSVRMSEPTKSYLHQRSTLSNPAWRNQTVGQVIDLKGTDYERSVTAVAKDIATRLTGKQEQLKPQEFQLRRAKNQGADKWHQDKEPKKVICIATVEGRGTEFIKPSESKKLFETGEYAEMIPKNAEADAQKTAEAIAQKTNEAKKDRFYFFAGKGITEESIPKLVHRSPHESGRAIFMARWK